MNPESLSGPAAGATPSPDATHSSSEGAAIKSVKLRHPIRNVFAVIIVLLAVAFVYDAALRPAFNWPQVAKYVFDRRISEAAFNTLQLTVYSMVIAVLLGILLAVMRLSPNPVFKSLSWFYLWVFRGTPVYVQLTFWGLLSVIYPVIDFGLPFVDPFISLPTGDALNVFQLAIIGLALNEAAYIAEIVRAGILSVDRGQDEAATALGMSWFQSMARVIIPQSMRVIIPPVGNEVISMLKTTSLVTAVPYSFDLFTRSRDISAEAFTPIPLFLVASIWYLAFTSILMIGQYFLEKRFARGIGAAQPEKKVTVATGLVTVVGSPSDDASEPPRDPRGDGTR
ncbi:amino acid ABC transporter permease [Frigoribacterium sp. CG_9.8]|uniref:amino acid ABC transporter permease n=1 Tax=Frigoribacterium sp. CG_9.8 TaxID=2787733 RepID=UPI001A1804DB|nr:polar amino acid transport system permease protein [Frigoribacterium sp. CG_9.8]